MGKTKIREIRVTNTATGKKEVLETLEPGKLRMYSCGPTVWNFIHIGNLRAALTPDMFFRYFKRVGYDVTYVRNYTDVDDKIINRAKEEKLLPEEISRKYTQEVEKDYAVAGLSEPSQKTTVTGHMGEIVAMIATLIERGHAYVVEGEVLYSIESFKRYGCLSGRKPEDMEAGARVEIDEKKRNPLDFALWKPAKPGEPFWESPWSKGRPGWHIECSAMACKHLGAQLDIHHGGEDLVFPHHENEIAQSEGASGKAPYVRFWLHNAFVNMAKQKMSKSLGNVLLARDFLAQYGGEFARYMFLSVHYRSILDFGDEAFESTLSGLHRIYEAKVKALALTRIKSAMPDPRSEEAWGSFVADVEKARREMDECFANDFNTPGVLASLFTLIREFNRVLAEPSLKSTTPAAILAGGLLIQLIEQDLGEVMGVGRSDPQKVLGDLDRIRANRPTASGAARPSEGEIALLIQKRLEARKAKDFAKADQIRKDLESRGVEIKDGPAGTTWRFI